MNDLNVLGQLKNSYKHKTLLIVSCGPSASFWRHVLSSLPENTSIACVKQSIFMCKSDAALHFFNGYNCQRYYPNNKNALKIYIKDEYHPQCLNRKDITFHLNMETAGKISKCLAYTERFDEHTIDKTGLTRCWGPGIMYDVVIHMALFLGFRHIHTVGWDIAMESQQPKNTFERRTHFYDSQITPFAGTRPEWLGSNLATYKSKAFARHFLGLPYNRVPKTDFKGEVPIILRSLPRFFDWLESEQVELTMHTHLQEQTVSEEIRMHVSNLPPCEDRPIWQSANVS